MLPKKLPKWIKTTLIIIGMIALVTFMSWYGVIGILVFFFTLLIIRLVKSRHQFLYSLRLAEGQIFGKPLDKDMWKKGELKDLKIRFKWRKKHDKHNTEVKKTIDQ